MDKDQNPHFFSIAEIKKLVALLEKSSLNDLTIRRGEHKVALSKGKFSAPPVLPSQMLVAQTPAATTEQPRLQSEEKSTAQANAPEPVAEGTTVTSPMVGTFYRAASPTSPNFVEIGQTVEEGQVLCIVEAMKTMNQIKAPVAGRITHIPVEDAQPVEFGQILVHIA